MDTSTDTQSEIDTNQTRLIGKIDKTGKPRLQVKAVNHFFGSGENKKQALFDNTLVAHPGEMIIMTGPSGSGKTTLLTLIGALRSLQEGQIWLDDAPYFDMSKSAQIAMRHNIGFIFQAHNLFDSLTAYENVKLATELVSPEHRKSCQKPEQLLAELGLEERIHYLPANLSGGQRQRVAVARALINRPKLILADEPTAALDKVAGRIVVNKIQQMCHDYGTTAMIVTHDSRILDVANRIVNMVDGVIVSDVDLQETEELMRLLHEVPVFKELTPSVLKDVAGKLAKESFAAQASIFNQGDAGDKFYIIRSGRVEILVESDGKGKRVAELTAGKFFGELALLHDQPRAATVRTLESTEVLSLSKPQFLKLIEEADTLEAQIRKIYFTG